MAADFFLSRDEVRELDRRAIHGFGVPGIVLMENAGRSCAELLMRLNPGRDPAVILCGPGNNGGDGFVIARHLDNHGWPVDVHVVARNNNSTQRGDADVNFDILFAAGIHYTQYHPEHLDQPQADAFLHRGLRRSAWIVDALFGTGLSRPLGPPYDRLVRGVNESGNPVLAVDIPSGLDCDTGEPLGPTIRATHTATFVAPKKGFANPNSREWTGEVHVLDIGAPRVLVEEYRTRSSERGASAL
jgi:NAD(P)H-hydrate epimerase